jgi:hypothetical protein
MESIKDRLKNKVFIKSEIKSSIINWQRYALEVVKDFNLKGQYKAMIFRQAKKNIEFLKGKVENTKEKFGTEKLDTKGNYLISLFRNKKPWIK